ncbi:hypothetical protein [Mycobacterium sp. 1164985.4]|uniref:hypothetical protein n=1 Tax=Mycobacterium sp. 1164985.4 TaxID=1834069 RepID=UPI00336AE82C
MLSELRDEGGDQSPTRPTQSLRTGVPIIQADVDRDSWYHHMVVTVAASDGARPRSPRMGTVLPITAGLSRGRDKCPGGRWHIPRCLPGILNHRSQSGK